MTFGLYCIEEVRLLAHAEVLAWMYCLHHLHPTRGRQIGGMVISPAFAFRRKTGCVDATYASVHRRILYSPLAKLCSERFKVTLLVALWEAATEVLGVTSR